MKKEDFYVYQNEFKTTENEETKDTLTKSEFHIEVAENSETEKELMDYLKKANPEHHSLNSPELADRIPTVYITATKEFWGNAYQESELYQADFNVTVDKPIHNVLTVSTNYELPEFEEIRKVLEEVMSDYEQKHYREIPEKYADVKLIDIQQKVLIDNNDFDNNGHMTKDNYTEQIEEILFRPQPDGMMEKSVVYSNIEGYDSVTPEEMETEIQKALQGNAIVAVTENGKTPITYQDWEANQHLKEIQQKQTEYTD